MGKLKLILAAIVIICATALLTLHFSIRTNSILKLTGEERVYLQSISPVKIAVDPDWPPFERLNTKKEYVGISADYIKIIEKRLGIRFEVVPTVDWNQSIEYSKEGKVNVLSLLNKSPEREKWLIFTEPLIVDDNVIIGRQDSSYIRDLRQEAGKTVVLPKGTSVEEKLKKDYPGLTVLLVDSEQKAFDMVQVGKADFTIRSMMVAEYNIRKQGWFDLKVIGKLEGYTNYLSMGVSKDHEMLRDLLNRAILSISEQERVDILNKHIPLRVEIKDSNRHIMFLLIIAIVGALFMLIAGSIQSYRARYLARHNKKIREITERYEALSELSGTYFWQMDMEGLYTYISPEVTKVLRFQKEELLGRNFREYIKTENIGDYERKMAGAQTLKDHEVPHYKKDGSYIWIKVDAMPVFDGKGKVVAYRGSSTDIELRKQLEHTLIEAKEAIELAYYQAQIGPHFLYNAMSAIAMYCQTEPMKASSLIVDLSFFLRKSYDFKNMNYLVTLSQELELIKAYTNIERVRFGSRLQVEYYIQEELYTQLIPPLILQPLIENAINHGLMKRIEGGTVVVSALKMGGKVLLSVQDNGVGMEEEQRKELLQAQVDSVRGGYKESHRQQGVGIKNIHGRLLKRYQSGLRIDQNEAGGTTVSFTLPESRKEFYD